MPLDGRERVPGREDFNSTGLSVRPNLKHPNVQFGRLFPALDSPKGPGNVFDPDYSSGQSTRVQSKEVYFRGSADAPVPTVNVVRGQQ